MIDEHVATFRAFRDQPNPPILTLVRHLCKRDLSRVCLESSVSTSGQYHQNARVNVSLLHFEFVSHYTQEQ